MKIVGLDKRYMLFAALGCIFASLSYLIFMYDPAHLIKVKIITFVPDSLPYYLWKDVDYEIYAKIYIFNVSNPDEFLSGKEKLRFNEVGPYVYREIQYNTNATFNENGTLSFVPRRLLKFIPERSIGDPDEDVMKTTNVPFLGVTAGLEDYAFPVKSVVAYATYALGAQPFLNLTATQYLFGYDDSLVTLANTVVPTWINFPRFGIIDRLMAIDNGSNIATINLNDPEKLKGKKAFSLELWNGLRGLPQWGYNKEDEPLSDNSTCNIVQGAFLGQVFPEGLGENDSFTLFRPGFCRPVLFKYEKTGYTKSGFMGHTYKAADNFLAPPDENPDNSCYYTKDNSPIKGLNDISACYYDIPVALSLPHFLNGDPMLLDQVDGLKPDKDKHDIRITIDPVSGLPLDANLKIQLNLRMPSSVSNTIAEPFVDLIIPLFWIELQVEDLPPNLHFLATLLYYVLPILQEVLKYLFALLGVVMIGGSAVALVYQPRTRHRDYLELPVNFKDIETFDIKSNLLESKL